MKILITGITGFVGSHLAEYIIERDEGHEIFGLCRWRSPRENLAGIYNKISMVEADLCDLSALRNGDRVKYGLGEFRIIYRKTKSRAGNISFKIRPVFQSTIVICFPNSKQRRAKIKSATAIGAFADFTYMPLRHLRSTLDSIAIPCSVNA